MNGNYFKSVRQLILILLFVSSLLLAGCANQSLTPDPSIIQIQTPKPVIFDTDMAHEDMFSALFLLSHPNVDVRAITVSGTGEAHCGPGVSHALGLVALSGHQDIPVACGREIMFSRQSGDRLSIMPTGLKSLLGERHRI